MRRLLCALFLLAGAAPARAAEITEIHRVPSVDGAEISVEVRRDPAAPPGPVLLTYSPYNTLSEPQPTADGLGDRYVERGYVRAVGDVLGTRNSGGCWDYGGPKEQQSGVDLVSWLARQPWSNGRVAMIGGSYDGTTANMVAARGEVPGLAAIVPEAAISRWYGYAYTNGVRHLGNTQHATDEGFDTPLAFDFGFGRTPPSDPGAAAVLADRVNPCDAAEHTAEAYSRTPDYDEFWLERDYRKDASRFAVPTLITHGWQDFNVHQEEGIELYEAIDRAPWKGLYVWQAPHAAPSGEEWEELLDGFFERFLRDAPNGFEGRPRVYTQTRDHASDGELEPLGAWPPPGTGDLELRLGRGAAGGTLGGAGGGDAGYADASTSTEEAAAADPQAERAWLAYASEPLAADARIAGAPVLELFLRAGREHGHVTPTLFDVDREGEAVPITRGFLDLRYRDGLAAAQPVPVGERVRAALALKPQDWTLRAGHRLVLVVASSNTAWAVPDDPGLAVEVLGDGSRLLLPVVGAAGGAATPVPGARRPAQPLPSRREAARLRLRVRRAGARRLRVTGRAPRRTLVRLRALRGSRTAARRAVRASGGRFRATLRVRRSGRYRVAAAVRTTDGVVRRRSRVLRLR